MIGEVVQEMLRRINERNDTTVGAVWLVGEETVEEKRDERDVFAACAEADVPYKIWGDEKYLIDEYDSFTCCLFLSLT
jgi:deoxyribodipyrimidine photo-lyase